MTRIRILDEAAEELEAAATYLESEREGYGALFLDAYEEKLLQISRFPTSAPLVRELPPDAGVRVFTLAQFRYSIVVAAVRGVLTIVAISHQSRAPDYWHERVR